MHPPESSPLATLTPARVFRGWVTLATAVLLLLFAGFSWLQSVRVPQLGQLAYPAESAGRVMERHLTFYEGFEAARGWERDLYRGAGLPRPVLRRPARAPRARGRRTGHRHGLQPAAPPLPHRQYDKIDAQTI